jgi:TolB-like protein/Flp pilus assembly protein TadD/predicted Ser/Thr protein kinase
MGEVYLADDSKLGRRVAIKMLPESFLRDPEAKKRMLREARAVAALDHPNVCTIHEVGEYEGRPYIVMQYVEGETLYERLEHTRFSLQECIDIASQIAAALDEAHSRGIIHRDIKTLNIMITPRGQVKVLDFGLAKLEQMSEASTELLMSTPGTVTGTAPYMSPEQLRGVPIDGRSDIFSLGIVLYEMATGHRPFDRENAVATITAILFDDLPPIEDEQYARLMPILKRALAKEPSKRFSTAAVMLEELHNLMDRQPSRSRRARVPAEVEATQALPAAPPAARPQGKIGSIAILAFAAEETDPEMEYLVYGLAESVAGALAHVRKLRVVAPASTDRWNESTLDAKQVGRDLNVAAVGVLRARADAQQVHVDVELLGTRDGNRLWHSQFHRSASEVTALADNIAADMVQHIRTASTLSSAPRKIMKKKRPVDPEAQHLFLKGRFQWVKRHPLALKQALGFFQQAVDLDPAFAQAFAGVADSYVMLATMQALPGRDILARVKAAARQAIDLDPTLAEPHAALGCAAGLIEWDWDTAHRELEEAMQLNPNYPWAPHWLGLLYSGAGKTERGLELIQLAQTLDPLSPIISVAVGITLHIGRRFDEAVQVYRTIIDSETSVTAANYYLALSYEQRGEFDAAIAQFNELIESAGPVSIYIAALAHCYGKAGRIADAEALVEQLKENARQRYVSPYAFFMARLGMKQFDEALVALEAAMEERNALLWFLPTEPRYDPLRDDSRFVALAQRYGLQPKVG